MIVRSIFSNWLGLIVTGAVAVVLTPFMIHHLGNFEYGMWVLVGSVLDYYGLLDLGIRTAVFRFVAQLKGSGDRKALNQTFATALAFASAICGLICVASILLAGPLSRFFTVPVESRPTFRWLILLLGGSVGITFPARLLGTYLTANNRWDLYNCVAILSTVARAGLIVLALDHGYGVISVGEIVLGLSVLSFIAHALMVRYVDPELRVAWKQTSWPRLKELFTFGVNSSFIMVGDYLRFYSDSAVIGKMLSVALITPFSVAGRLMEFFKSVVVAAGGPLLGTMSELDGQSREEDLGHLFLRSTRFMALLSLLGGLLLLLNGKSLIRIWVGKDLLNAYPILAVFTVAYIVGMAQHPALLITIARAEHGPLGRWSVVEGLANLGLSIYWAHRYGIMGVAMGTVVPMLVMKMSVQPWYALSAAKVSLLRYLKEGLGRAIIVGAVFTAICVIVARDHAELSFLSFILRITWQTGVYLFLSYWIGLVSEERRKLLSRGQRLFALSAGAA